MTEKIIPSGYILNISLEAYLTLFYFFVFLVSCTILNIAYVSYSISRSYFTMTWPLHLLRNVAKIFVTVLFQPMLGIITKLITRIFNECFSM